MKKIFLFMWLALLLQACQTSPVHQNAMYLLNDTNFAYVSNQSNQWTINNDSRNVKSAMTALRAFETGDTALLKTCVADSLTVHYDGGTYKGGKHEFMFAIVEVVKALKNLRIKVKDCQSVVSNDKSKEKVTTWYTQYWTTPQGLADSADVIDDAVFKDGKIVVWYDYMRRYKK